jgi:hypothetical protein
VERCIGYGLCLWLLTLFAMAVHRLALLRLATGDQDGAFLCWLLLAPLPWFLFLHLLALRPREWWSAPPKIAPAPGGRLRLAGVGPEVTVHLVPPLPPGRRLLRATLKLTFILAAAAMVAVLAGRGNKLDAMILAIFSGIIGAALAGMLLQGLAPRLVWQIRDGYIRSGRPRYGGVVGGSPWQRRSEGAGRDRDDLLDANEQRWLKSLQDPADVSPPADPATVAVFSRPAQAVGDPARGLAVQVGLRNTGATPVTLANLEQASRGRFVAVTIDGVPASLCFSSAARHRLIPAGRDTTVMARLFPAQAPQGRSTVQVELLGASVHTAPFRYALQEGK